MSCMEENSCHKCTEKSTCAAVGGPMGRPRSSALLVKFDMSPLFCRACNIVFFITEYLFNVFTFRFILFI